MPFITQEKTNWKFLFIVVFIALIAGGSILWLGMRQDFYYETPGVTIHKKVLNETADWQTYRNQEYGFEVKYFSQWEIMHEGYYNEKAPYEVSFAPKNLEGPYAAPISILIKTQNSEEICYASAGGILISKSEITIDNIKSQQAICGDGPEGGFGVISIPLKNNLIYELRYNNTEWEEVFNQMLSTFRFIK